MHIAIVGAGAVGGTLAARLHRSGRSVTLVARGAAARSIAAHGLRVQDERGREVVPMPTVEQVPADADIVFLAVKSHRTQTALYGCPPVPVVSFQAGVDNEPMIAARHPTIGAVVGFGAECVEPGVVVHRGPLRVDLGDWPTGVQALTEVADVLGAAGFDVCCRDDIEGWKFAQLIHDLSQAQHVLCGAIDDELTVRLLSAAERVAIERLGRALPSREALAARHGFPVEQYGRTQRERGPLWQSCVNGRRSEAESLLGVFFGSDEGRTFRRLSNLVSTLEVPGSYDPGHLRDLLDAPGDQACDLKVRTLLERARGRPGMFVGEPTTDGAEHLFGEVLGNAVDQHILGRCAHTDVTLHEDGFTVSDDGPGMDDKLVHRALTHLHGGATLDGHWPHVHLRKDGIGVGLVALNALSSRLEVTNRREGRATHRIYAYGELVDGPIELAPPASSGLTIACTLDRSIITAPLRREHIAETLERVTALTNLRATLEGRAVPSDGFAGYLRRRHGAPARPPDLTRRANVDGIDVEAIVWFDAPPARVSFVNLRPSIDGTHVTGALEAMGTRASGAFLGVHAVLTSPRFATPTHDHLASPEVRAAVRVVVSDAISAG